MNIEDYSIEELRKLLATKEKEEAEKKKAEEEAKAKKLAEEKETRKKEIEEAEKHLAELYKKYIKDYGPIAIRHNSNDYDGFWYPLLNKLWF